jgi:transcriptional regulator with GAF, ATPase, and Fis domain
MIRFRVEEPTRVRLLEVDFDAMTVGRAAGCTIAIDDPMVGRFHASLQRDGVVVKVVLSGRGGGSWLNGRPLSETAEMRVGDRLTVGKSHIVIDAILPRGKSAPAEPPAPRAAPAPPPAPTEPPESTVGFSTEMLRAPGSGGEEEARALRRILEINKRLARAAADEPRLLEHILEAAVDLTGAGRGVLALRDGDEPRARAWRGFEAERDSSWIPPTRRVVQSNRTLRHEGSGGDGDGRALVCVPLRGEGAVLGALYLDRPLGEAAFPARAVALLEAFADQAAVALHSARLVAENRGRAVALEAAGHELEKANAALAEALRRRTVELHSAREDAALARSDMRLKFTYDRIIGRSAAMRTLLALVDKVTESTVPVLVEGESGTGKELVARAIHRNGPRGNAPFIVENCAAVPDPLIENELFGHERGAFTGADRAQDGLFERAHGGTLFLDEVGDMSPEMQKKLLRVLQEGEVRRVGGHTVRKVDVRVVSATNRDVARMVKDGTFREDLFYRLCVVRVRIPPLRERREDVALLAAHFLDRIARESPSGAPRMEADALDALSEYPWPGNVRELENEVRRAATLADGVITREILSPDVRGAGREIRSETPQEGVSAGAQGTLKDAVESLERGLVVESLRRHAGNKTRAALALGLSRLGLRKKMARYGIEEGL